ncbi:MAG: UDP-N-acetylmuramoyl-L-alanine--D-glutamate ligase [Sphingobium sp.]
MIVSPAFSARRYAVLGLARSGLATVEALHASGAAVLAWDSREDARAAVAGKAEIGDLLEADLTGYDGIVVSPGVPINRHPIAEKARTSGVPLIGDIELFALARPSLPAHRVVGITGTNGKSTTTALVHHICRNAGLPTRMGGNIGLPILAQEPLPAGGVYVLELSSYQIDLTYNLDCDVAALLNITPDHLDRYDDGFAGYAASKERLFDMQSPAHVAVIAADDEPTRGIAARHPRAVRVSAGDIDLAEQLDWPSLQGPHNAQNVAVSRAVADALHIGPAGVRDALRSYASLPHRMQIVLERGGVLFVNDSKATNAASTAPALAAWPAREGHARIHWILGGLAKSDSLDDCAAGFPNVAHAYTIGEAGPKFAGLLRGVMPVDECELLITAVQQAAANARPGDVVLLSPACASFDQFRDFEARGDAFVAAVNALDGDAGQ